MNWLLNFVKKWFSNNDVTQKIEIFPCKECLILTSCMELCNKIEMDDKKLYAKIIKYECCPDCGGIEFREGPRGGASLNVMCIKCRHKFNIVGDLWDIQRIGI